MITRKVFVCPGRFLGLTDSNTPFSETLLCQAIIHNRIAYVCCVGICHVAMVRSMRNTYVLLSRHSQSQLSRQLSTSPQAQDHSHLIQLPPEAPAPARTAEPVLELSTLCSHCGIT